MANRDNSGAIFKNDRKETENQPDYRGEVMIEGVEYRLSGWINTSQKGTKYIGVKVQEKQDYPGQQAPSQAPAQAPAEDDFQDEIPF